MPPLHERYNGKHWQLRDIIYISVDVVKDDTYFSVHINWDAFVVVGEWRLYDINSEAIAWCNKSRPHSARYPLPPTWDKPRMQETVKLSEIVCTKRLSDQWWP